MLFSIFHIGARDGNREFPKIPAFSAAEKTHLFECEKKAVSALQRQRLPNHYVWPYALAEKDEKAVFQHTRSPYASSILKPHQGEEKWNLFWVDHDLVLEQALEVIKTESIQARSLDSLLAKEMENVEKPNFISLDTQGSELAILRGASGALEESVVGVVCEVEFHSLYEGQPLFGDVAAFLKKAGFWFICFYDLLELSPGRYPVGLRGLGMQVTGNALFLRNPLNLISKKKLLPKLAYCALMFSRFEIAWRAFDMPEFPNLNEGKDPISQFLFDVKDAYLKHPQKYPPDYYQYLNGVSSIKKGSQKKSNLQKKLEKWGMHQQASILKNESKRQHL